MNNADNDEFDFPEDYLEEWRSLAQTVRGRRQVKMLGSPKVIQQRNLRDVLIWVYSWGFSSADIISDVLGRQNRSHARRMAENGWLNKVQIKGYPAYFTLTEKGLAMAENESPHPKLLDYKEIDPYRVHLPTLHHDLIAQAETLRALRDGWFTDYLSPRMFDFPKKDGPKKIPDAILLRFLPGEFGEMVTEWTALEAELTTKRGFKLDLFATDMLHDLQEQRYARAIIVSNSAAVFRHYQEQFKPGTKIKLWEYGKIKVVDTGKMYTVPEWAPRFVMFRAVSDQSAYRY